MKITALLLSLPLALAHPGHEEPEHQLAYKRHFNAQARRGLNACSEQLTKRGVFQRAQERRAATVERYRKAYGLHARDTDTVINTSHLSNESYTPNTAETTIFETSNTCVVNPEGETGPYWVKGEYIRSNLRESQTGVPIVIEGQFLDIETCSPLTNVWWDIWNCNATGVYAGVVEQGNGNTADTANINATFLRGIQQADSDGVVTFESIFPGHYSGRATHHHMIVHIGATVADNNTLVGGTYAHVGQVFWDQDLINKVEATSPYSTNTISITENADDRVFSTETADTTSDPVFEYVYLGDDLSDGLFGWITVVVNTSATYDPNYSFALTSAGGISESGGSMSVDGGSGGGGPSSGNSTGGAGGPPSGNSTTGAGGPGGNGTMPSGSGAPGGNGTAGAPSGAPSTGSVTAVGPTSSASATGSVVAVSTGSARGSGVSNTVLTASLVGAVSSIVSVMGFSTFSTKTSPGGAAGPSGGPSGGASDALGGVPSGAPSGAPNGDAPSGAFSGTPNGVPSGIPIATRTGNSHSRPNQGHDNDHTRSGSISQSKPTAHSGASFGVPSGSQPTAAPTIACSG